MSNTFNLDNNIMFSKLNNDELRNLMGYLMSYSLPYRDSLNLGKDISIGTEIEYEKVATSIVEFFVNEIMRNWSLNEWLFKKDATILDGGEVVSPIFYDEKNAWEELKQICAFLKANKADTLGNTAGQVHIGASILGDNYDNWRKFIKLYTIFENILFRFGFGDKMIGRTKIKLYAPPIANNLLGKMWRINYAKSIKELENILPIATRYRALNFKNVHFDSISDLEGNTIEFRFPNATVEEVIWQNMINTFGKMLLAARSSNLDEEYLDYLLKEEECLSYTFANSDTYYKRYQEVCLKKALIFVDLIFNNSLDKINFLCQYLKLSSKSEETTLIR